MLAALTLVAALSAPLPPPYKAACPTSRARYVLRDQPKISLRFQRYGDPLQRGVSDVYIVLHSERSKKTYWFEMDWGTSSIRNVYPIYDPVLGAVPSSDKADKAPPYDNMTIWTADGALRFYEDDIEGAHPAPKYILIPELSDAMWYGGEPRESVGTAFFILKSCAKR